MADVTSGAVNVGDDTVVLESMMPPGADHKYVRVSPSGSDEPEPFNVTVSRSEAVWLEPALATGARLAWLTDIVTVSVSDSVPSETVSLNTNVVGLAGAVKVGDDAVELDRVTVVPEVWVHEYDIVSPSMSEEPVPFRVTVSPVDTDWPVPALEVGARLTCPTNTVTVSLSVRPPVSVTVSVKV